MAENFGPRWCYMRLGAVRTIRAIYFFLRMAYFKTFYKNIYFEGVASLQSGASLKVTDGASIYIGNSVSVSRGVTIVAQAGSIRIGDNVFVGAWSTITAKDKIIIGNDTLIGERVTIRDQDHKIDGLYNVPMAQAGFSVFPITMGSDVWIGAGAVILKGVSIGDGAVIGANAVVSKDVEPRTIVGGVPARVIGYRSADSRESS